MMDIFSARLLFSSHEKGRLRYVEEM